MTGSEIFSRLSAADVHQVFESLFASDKATYKACVQITAQRRRLRSVFLEKKSRPERHAWMQNVLAMPANDDAATEILQNWLLGLHRSMIIEFLDACGLKHEDALLEDIPVQPKPDVLKSAIDRLLDGHPGVESRIYLQIFQPVGTEAWPDLDHLLASDPRFQTHLAASV